MNRIANRLFAILTFLSLLAIVIFGLVKYQFGLQKIDVQLQYETLKYTQTHKPILISQLKHEVLISLGEIAIIASLLLGFMNYLMRRYLVAPLETLQQAMLHTEEVLEDEDDSRAIDSLLDSTPQMRNSRVFPEVNHMGTIFQSVLSNLVERQQRIWIQDENLRTTFNSIGDAIIATDAQGFVTRMNPVAEGLTGWTQDDALGRPVTAIFKPINPITRKAAPNPINTVLKSGSQIESTYRTTLVSKNGHECQIADSATPILDAHKQVEGAVLVFRDISDEYAMRTALEAERTRSLSILQGTNAGTWDWNVQTGHLSIDQRWAEIIGYSLNELAPINQATWEKSVHPDDLKKAKNALNQHFMKRVDYYDFEFRQRHKDGHWVWVNARGKVVKWTNDGLPIRMSGTHLDITNRKKAQADLIAAKEQAEAANRAKDEFLAVMSHEMRTPLNPILGFAEMMRQNSNNQTNIGYLEIIMNAANRQLRLIDDILDYMRINTGKIEPTPEPFTLSDLCEIAVHEAMPMAEGLELEYTNGQHGLPVNDNVNVICDLMMLRRIIDNLLSNACKYTHEGHVKLDLSQKEDMAKPVYTISVEDTGIGITPEIQSRLFEAFSQADSSYTRKHEGLGLGLAICKRLTQILGGQISVKSAVGIGSTITLTLPLKTIGYNSLTSAPFKFEKKADNLIGEYSVLIADDKDDNLLIAKAIVESFNAKTTLVHNGLEAYEICQKQQFDAIMMDLAMPIVNGFEASQKIREDDTSKNQTTPIIAVTADVTDNVRQTCIDAGIEHYISKPIASDKLLHALQQCVGEVRE